MNTFVEFDLDDLVTRDLVEPPAGAAKSAFKKKQAKAKRLIFESIKDGMMPLLQPLAIAKECIDALSRLFDRDAPSLERTLKKQLHIIKMNKNETVASFMSIFMLKSCFFKDLFKEGASTSYSLESVSIQSLAVGKDWTRGIMLSLIDSNMSLLALACFFL